MKKIALALLLVVLAAVYGGIGVLQGATDVLKQLGISDEEAGDYVWWNLSGEVFSYPRRQELKQKAPSERAALVQQICAYAKSYTESEEFKKKYLENREGSKPTPPEKPEPVEEMRARMKKEMQASIDETEKSIGSMPEEHREMMRATVDMLKEQLKSYDDPDNPMFSKDTEKMMMQMYDAQLEQHKKDLAEWEKNNPTDPKSMVRKRLEKFLEETKDVDFNAALIDGDYGKKYFSKHEYEMKPSNWKVCYRAGKESVEAARTFVRNWLDDLNRK